MYVGMCRAVSCPLESAACVEVAGCTQNVISFGTILIRLQMIQCHMAAGFKFAENIETTHRHAVLGSPYYLSNNIGYFHMRVSRKLGIYFI